MATVNGQNEEVKSMINEVVQKLVKGVTGIEILFGINMDDFQWTINTPENTYQIYFEKFKKENKVENDKT